MGAWAYCIECDEGLHKPTLKEMWNHEQRCRNGHYNQPGGDMGEMLGELDERVAKLEADNTKLKKQIARLRGELSGKMDDIPF